MIIYKANEKAKEIKQIKKIVKKFNYALEQKITMKASIVGLEIIDYKNLSERKLETDAHIIRDVVDEFEIFQSGESMSGVYKITERFKISEINESGYLTLTINIIKEKDKEESENNKYICDVFDVDETHHNDITCDKIILTFGNVKTDLFLKRIIKMLSKNTTFSG